MNEGNGPPPMVSTGIAELDGILSRGLTANRVYLIEGNPGAGKTTLALQFLLEGARRGEKGLYVTLSETKAELQAVADSHGWSLDDLHIHELVDPQNSFEPDAQYTIDSLNGYLNAMPEERFLSIQLHELLTYLGSHGVVTFLVMAQHGMLGSSMISPVDASYLADAVILFRYFESQGEVRQAISVVKKRSGAHERSIREFHMNSAGIQVGQPLRDFHGVLSGTPTYFGSESDLMRKKDG